MSSNRPSTADTNTELHKLEETAASTAASSPDDELNYASTPDPSFQVPQHLRNGLITRHVVMQWDNSMDGLASAPQNATCPSDFHRALVSPSCFSSVHY
jgi:hypothetical protein